MMRKGVYREKENYNEELYNNIHIRREDILNHVGFKNISTKAITITRSIFYHPSSIR
jgi:hypothetical protein